MTLHQQFAAAKTPHERTLLQQQIEATDGQIDRLGYELYGLTEEEIQIVGEFVMGGNELWGRGGRQYLLIIPPI